jgi:general stress protein 26
MPSPAPNDAKQEWQVERLLAAARDTICEVPFCWVVTAAADGAANARVVMAQATRGGEDFWTRWFLTPRIGRKAVEIGRAGRVTLAYQHDSGDAYVALSGRAELLDDRAEVESRCSDGNLAARLIAVRVTADHLELHVRGVTAEPWGRGRTLLDRAPDGSWRLVA